MSSNIKSIKITGVNTVEVALLTVSHKALGEIKHSAIITVDSGLRANSTYQTTSNVQKSL